jgi:hypothetical protein
MGGAKGGADGSSLAPNVVIERQSTPVLALLARFRKYIESLQAA